MQRILADASIHLFSIVCSQLLHTAATLDKIKGDINTAIFLGLVDRFPAFSKFIADQDFSQVCVGGEARFCCESDVF